MIQAIKLAWDAELEKRKIFHTLAFRISQIYNDGACVYLYYGIGSTDGRDQLEVFEELTDIVRKAINISGGSLSHHHGIGKKSSKYYADAVSDVGVQIFKAIKAKLDPNNVFDAGNLIGDGNMSKL